MDGALNGLYLKKNRQRLSSVIVDYWEENMNKRALNNFLHRYFWFVNESY